VSPPAATVFLSVVLGCGVGFFVGLGEDEGFRVEGDGAGAGDETAAGTSTSDGAAAVLPADG
jgi:hypothetical protein